MNNNSYMKILKENTDQPKYRYTPKKGEVFWYVNLWTKFVTNIRLENSEPDILVECFRTKQEAEKYLEFLLTKNKLIESHFEISEGWIPNWNEGDEAKHFVFYNYGSNNFLFDYNFSYTYDPHGFYFRTEEQAKLFLRNNIEELKIYFGIDK